MDWQTVCVSRVAVLGCGNIYKGDDGLGPRVVELLERDPELPADVGLLDVGASIRTVLLDLAVAEARPRRIIVVDAVTVPGRAPGEAWEADLGQVDSPPASGFSLHGFPALSMLQDLRRHTGIEVRVVAVQAGCIPEGMEEGLSPDLAAALPRVAELVKRIAREP
jgi:coenzyme F420 hydrogenase subunit delta